MDRSLKLQQAILLHLFALNKSATKKITIGLDFKDSESLELEPKVRLLGGSDLQGIDFSISVWETLKKKFNAIEDYFKPSTTLKDGDIIILQNFIIRLCSMYDSKAFEIQETSGEEFNLPPSKKIFKKNLFFKQNTFACLKNVTKCIDIKIDYLKKIATSVNTIKDELVQFLFTMLAAQYEAQVTTINKKDVYHMVNNLEASKIDDLTLKIFNSDKFDKKIINDSEFIKYIIYEFISVNVSYIIRCLEKCVEETNEVN